MDRSQVSDQQYNPATEPATASALVRIAEAQQAAETARQATAKLQSGGAQ